MAEIINLRQHRKQAARAGKEQKAEANRRKFGEPKPLREAREKNEALAAKSLNAHRREET